MRKPILLLILSVLMTSCASVEKKEAECPSPVWPSDYVMERMSTYPQGVKDWYGRIITQQCLLDGGSYEECTQ